jgi:tetratricopeptide (TPR) repeat protein
MTQAADQKIPYFRLYCSRRTRRLLGGSAVAMLAGGLLAGWALASTPAGLPTCCTLLGLAVLLGGLASRTTLVGEECAFCGKPRRQLRRLVAGAHVAICEGCAAFALAAATEQGGQASDWVAPFIDALPSWCPLKISRPFLEQLLGDSNDPARLRDVARSAARMHNHALASELLGRIAESERQSEDWLYLGVALGRCARYADALDATERALASADGSHRPWCLNNRVWYRCWLAPEISAEAAHQWLAELEEARQIFSQSPDGAGSVGVQCCWGTEAELRSRLGDHTQALRALGSAEALAPLHPDRLLIRARVLARAQLPDRAIEEAKHALEGLHPESLAAQQAQQLLSSLNLPTAEPAAG